MNKWTKTAGIIFLAAASVYSDRAIAAKPGTPAKAASDKAPATDVKLLEETDPFAATGPTTEPSSTATENKAPAAPVQVNPDGTFSLNITAGADVVEQLRVIGFQAQESVIPSKEVHGTLPAMDLYNVTVHEALDALLHSSGYAWREKGKFIYVYSAKEIADQDKASRITNTEIFHLYYTPAANAVTMIKPVLSAEAQVAVTTPAKSSIATGTTDVGGNDHGGDDMIVVSDYPENLEKVRAILKEVDHRPQQIIVEATIMRATLNEDNALGVDFNVVGGVDFANITQTVAGVAPAFGTGSVAVNGGVPPHSIGTGNSFTNGISSGLKMGVVTNNVNVFISALEGITDTTIMANPKVLALNKQKAEVIVGSETGYLTTTTTETSSTQTVEFLKTGTRLVFRPYIGDDGYIRMEVHPEDSSGGLQTAANLPFKTTTEVTSNVMVKDGHTIVIGGLFRDESSSTKSQVPILGNLPLAGALFRQKRDTTKREEVIILLTPHIVKDDSAYSQLSEQELKDAEKLRVGVRKGMMWTGRSRLAESHYEKALAEMAKPKPNRSKAIWELNCAINLNPQYIEAINMRQELTGKEIAGSDFSSIRTFVKKSMLVDKAAPTTQAFNSDATTDETASATDHDPQQQDSQVAAATPTTQPQSNQAVAQVDATADGQQPLNSTDQSAVSSPVTELAAAPTTKPASQPSMADDQKKQPVDSDQVIGSEHPTKTSVTELPTEEVPSASGSSGDAGLNK